ncbi:MAG: hypothetical protein IPJ03_16595 [Ignavibacteriales bacterium]|nr:hypothetical protein [Ignavibacteriales bacterium]
MRIIFLDFEFRKTNERFVDLVACSLISEGRKETLWLYRNEQDKNRLREFLLKNKNAIYAAYNVIAEASCFISLGLNPLDFKWVDLHIEYKMLLNQRRYFMYGRQLIKGKVKVTYPEISKYKENPELDFKPHDRAPTSLGAACFKLLNIKIDTEHKNKMRDLIIDSDTFSASEIVDILKYCESDTEHLKPLLDQILLCQKSVPPEITLEERLFRGQIGAASSLVTSEGYPVNLKKTLNFQKNLPIATKELCSEINKQFSDPLFLWDLKSGKYKTRVKKIKERISALYPDLVGAWKLTDTGALSLETDFLKSYFDIRHTYKQGDLVHQLVRYNDFIKNTKYLKPSSERGKNFNEALGSDSRARAWLNPYGAQTGRFQPKSSHFLFLKSAWMRSLCEPIKGRVVIGVDYASQEFLLQGCISGDEEIYNSYMSGDVYVDFGKKTGLVKVDANGKYDKVERAAAKAAVLGIGYGMQANSLARRISEDSKPCTKDEAQKFIDAFYSLYKVYAEFRRETYITYKKKGYLKSLDGWVLYGDLDNKNSILNFPLQGAGAAILRKAILLCYSEGLTPIAPLHDALYVECDLSELSRTYLKLCECMRKASGHYFQGNAKIWAESIRLDGTAWGPDLSVGHLTIGDNKIETSQIYIDERAVSEYNFYSKYFLKESPCENLTLSLMNA